MGVTFDQLIWPYKYEYRAKNLEPNGHRMIVFANEIKEFYEDLQILGLYDEYIAERDKNIPTHEGQYNIYDYLGGEK